MTDLTLDELRRMARAPQHHSNYALAGALHSVLDRLEVADQERDDLQLHLAAIDNPASILFGPDHPNGLTPAMRALRTAIAQRDEIATKAEHATVRCGVLVEFLVVFGSHTDWCRWHRPGATGDDCDCGYGQAIGMYRGDADRVIAERDEARDALRQAPARATALRDAIEQIMPRYIELYEAAELGDVSDSIAVQIARAVLAAPEAQEAQP